MSIKITDGRGSAAHITSNDIVGKQQASLRTESRVYAVGNQFAYTLVDNNTIEIADGEGSIWGCFWRILPGTVEEVTLTTGTQGMYRYDLIVARYTQDESGVESVSLVVLQGEEAESEEEAVVPEITEADIRDTVQISDCALYKVFINGINVESVTSMMSICHNLQTVGDVVGGDEYDSEADYDAGALFIKDNALYKATEALVGGEHDESKIERTTIADELTSLNGNCLKKEWTLIGETSSTTEISFDATEWTELLVFVYHDSTTNADFFNIPTFLLSSTVRYYSRGGYHSGTAGVLIAIGATLTSIVGWRFRVDGSNYLNSYCHIQLYGR